MRDRVRSFDRSLDGDSGAAQLRHMCRVDDNAGRFAVDDGIKRAAVRDVRTEPAVSCLNRQPREKNERRDVDKRHALDPNGTCRVCSNDGVGTHDAGRCVEHNRRPVAARHHQPSLEGDRRHCDDTMAGHHAAAVVVEEENTGVGAGRDRFGEHGAAHVGMPARLEQERSPQPVGMARHPLPLFSHRPAGRRRKAFDHKTQRFARRVRVDCANDQR